jgi:hypothetical protein
MKRSRRKKKAQEPDAHDLSFPTPYAEQAKYLYLADRFLSTNGTRHNVVRIDTHKNFKANKKKAA